MFVLSKLLPTRWRERVGPWLLRGFRKYAGMTTEQYFSKFSNPRLASLLGSLWLDTGSAPHSSSFVMNAGVVYGFPQRGGAFPKGGAQVLSNKQFHPYANWFHVC